MRQSCRLRTCNLARIACTARDPVNFYPCDSRTGSRRSFRLCRTILIADYQIKTPLISRTAPSCSDCRIRTTQAISIFRQRQNGLPEHRSQPDRRKARTSVQTCDLRAYHRKQLRDNMPYETLGKDHPDNTTGKSSLKIYTPAII